VYCGCAEGSDFLVLSCTMAHSLTALCSGGLSVAVASVNDVALAAVLSEGDGAGAYP
jgi:hypothetical protein